MNISLCESDIMNNDNEFVEMLFVDSLAQKFNDASPEVEVFSYTDDIIEHIDVLEPDKLLSG